MRKELNRKTKKKKNAVIKIYKKNWSEKRKKE